MEATIIATLAVLIGLGFGGIGGFFGRRLWSGKRRAAAVQEASRTLDEAREQERRILLEARKRRSGFGPKGTRSKGSSVPSFSGPSDAWRVARRT